MMNEPEIRQRGTAPSTVASTILLAAGLVLLVLAVIYLGF
jgi:hypothetical protein